MLQNADVLPDHVMRQMNTGIRRRKFPANRDEALQQIASLQGAFVEKVYPVQILQDIIFVHHCLSTINWIS